MKLTHSQREERKFREKKEKKKNKNRNQKKIKLLNKYVCENGY